MLCFHSWTFELNRYSAEHAKSPTSLPVSSYKNLQWLLNSAFPSLPPLFPPSPLLTLPLPLPLSLSPSPTPFPLLPLPLPSLLPLPCPSPFSSPSPFLIFCYKGVFVVFFFFSDYLPAWFLTTFLLKWLLGKLTFMSRWVHNSALFCSSRSPILVVPCRLRSWACFPPEFLLALSLQMESSA